MKKQWIALLCALTLLLGCALALADGRPRILDRANLFTSSEEEVTNCGMFSEFVKISTASPRKAIASRKPQKNSVPKIIPTKTAQAVA